MRVEATVQCPMDGENTDLETIVAVIARSLIVVAEPALRQRLPAGFDEADVAILNWIAAAGRRAGQNFARM